LSSARFAAAIATWTSIANTPTSDPDQRSVHTTVKEPFGHGERIIGTVSAVPAWGSFKNLKTLSARVDDRD
jgi:hypothetical protein